jgi:hypothetical protein
MCDAADPSPPRCLCSPCGHSPHSPHSPLLPSSSACLCHCCHRQPSLIPWRPRPILACSGGGGCWVMVMSWWPTPPFVAVMVVVVGPSLSCLLHLVVPIPIAPHFHPASSCSQQRLGMLWWHGCCCCGHGSRVVVS